MTPLRILLAEDNRGDVFLVRQALDDAGLKYELHVMDDGQKALDYVSAVGQTTLSPDILLLDLNLPKADGHEILLAFRSHPICSAIPVIVVSSSDAPSDRKRVADAGATRYFRKPVQLKEFLRLGAVVREVLAA
jgi:chemotaxis family two-component system response regulator Rcp1